MPLFQIRHRTEHAGKPDSLVVLRLPSSCPTQALIDYVANIDITDKQGRLTSIRSRIDHVEIHDDADTHLMSAIDVVDTLERAIVMDVTPNSPVLMCPKGGTHLLPA